MNTVFLCQITESQVKVIKCLISCISKRKFAGLEVEAISPNVDSKELSEKLSRIFKRLGYNNKDDVIVSFPSNKLTCRYTKIPSGKAAEIENIISLQAPKYLPYPANELATGYQILSVDKGGYASINMIIAQKDAVEGYFRMFRELGIKKLKVIPSSFGLVNFYDYIKPKQHGVMIVINISPPHVELAISFNRKLLFCRYFKFERSLPGWEGVFISEINKTRDTYLKETNGGAPEKIIVIGASDICKEFSQLLEDQAGLAVEALSYDDIGFTKEFLDKILASNSLFAGIIGLGLEDSEESLSLFSQELKEARRRSAQRKLRLRSTALISGIILMLGLGASKNLDNKTLYLKRLKIEVNKISKEAIPLEQMEKRLYIMEKRLQKKPSSLELFSEIYRIIPDQVSLIALNYDDPNRITLRGQASELVHVFMFASQLEKSPFFKGFDIKVKYAAKNKADAEENVGFEITCFQK
ncbi:MAG: PilN domain-containing protein [bacterium]|nr:PilN domain-containing protein [bacterium]